MSSSPVQGDDNHQPSLSTMPPEVAINIFCQLPSFFDVFALSAVCCRLRYLWLENVNSVYSQIARRTIPCEHAARRFLVDQDGPGLGSPISAKDVVRIVRNAAVIESAILQFEQQIVCRVRTDTPFDQDYYRPRVRDHPPTLTRTERTRFIRTYYSLWSLMRLDRSEWDSRLQAMTSQELYYLREMANLPQSIGREETLPPPSYPHDPSNSVLYVSAFHPSAKRSALERMIWQQIDCNSWRFVGQHAQDPCIYAKHEGFLTFIVLWDHWQPFLKDMVCNGSGSSVKPSPAVKEQYLWNDGLDE